MALTLTPLVFTMAAYAPIRIFLNTKCCDLIDSIICRISGISTYKQDGYTFNGSELTTIKTSLNFLKQSDALSTSVVYMTSDSCKSIRRLHQVDFFGTVLRIRALLKDLEKLEGIQETRTNYIKEYASVRVCLNQMEMTLNTIYDCICGIEREILQHSDKYLSNWRSLDLSPHFGQLIELKTKVEQNQNELYKCIGFWMHMKN